MTSLQLALVIVCVAVATYCFIVIERCNRESNRLAKLGLDVGKLWSQAVYDAVAFLDSGSPDKARKRLAQGIDDVANEYTLFALHEKQK